MGSPLSKELLESQMGLGVKKHVNVLCSLHGSAPKNPRCNDFDSLSNPQSYFFVHTPLVGAIIVVTVKIH